MIKKIINKTLSGLGYRLVKDDKKISRESSLGVLKNISELWRPDNIIDVGAAYGSWAEKCSKIFPEAKYFLLEPLKEFLPALEKLAIKNITLINKAAASESGEKIFNVHGDLFGSSLFKEAEGEEIDGEERKISCTTLDAVKEENKIRGGILLKLDVQGAELSALKGAKNILEETEIVILEASFFKAFKGGNDFYDIIDFMKNSGFVVYDIFGALYRPYDRALCQIDLIFARENGLFRKFHGYATKKQRAEQNNKFSGQLNKILKK